MTYAILALVCIAAGALGHKWLARQAGGLEKQASAEVTQLKDKIG